MSRIQAPSDETTGNLVDRLLSGLPPEAVLVDPDVTASYGHDMASFCEAGVPAVVVLPRTVEQVQHVMRVATELRVPVVPQGARTGLSGGANASEGCVVLSLTKMDRILEINPVDRIAVVEPGVINATLSRAVNEHGLQYPPDPSSWEMCTIGGNIGTASGGLCCVKYGVTAEYVLGLDVVLADGRIDVHRQAHREGRRLLRPHAALRRLGGLARHRRTGDPGAQAAAARATGARRGVRVGGGRLRRGVPDHGRMGTSPHCSNSWTVRR